MADLTTRSDLELFGHVQSGEVSAFDILFTRYWAVLCTFAVRYTRSRPDAQDLVQSVFSRLWIDRNAVVIHTSVRGYLYAAVRSRALHGLDHAKVEARWSAIAEGDDVPAMGSAPLPPDEAALRTELRQTLAAALTTLSPRVQQVAELRWVEGLGRTEIAQVLGVSPRTVDNQMATALAALRRELGNAGE